MTTCKLSTCDRPAGESGHDGYRRQFCSPKCELKYEHIKADARDAKRADRERHVDDRHPGERGQF